jgi:CBS domain-containing protein
MWRNDRDRHDDPFTPAQETRRLSRDEYDRPRYGSPPAEPRVPKTENRWGPQDVPRTARHPNSPEQPGRWDSFAHGQTPSQPSAGVERWRENPREHAPQPPAGSPAGVDRRHDNPREHPAQAPARSPAPIERWQDNPPEHRRREQRDIDSLRVHELMTRRVSSVHPASSVERAARLMEECDCGALPVVGDDGVLVGIVTDRDIVVRVVARGRDVRNAIVADCMSERVVACYANESVAECMHQMARHRVRRMPIVDERGRLVGIVSQGDLARHAFHRPVRDERDAMLDVVGAVSEPRSYR